MFCKYGFVLLAIGVLSESIGSCLLLIWMAAAQVTQKDYREIDFQGTWR